MNLRRVAWSCASYERYLPSKPTFAKCVFYSLDSSRCILYEAYAVIIAEGVANFRQIV
jgi:hypothetical protein